MSSNVKFSSLYQIFKLSVEVAGRYGKEYKNSLALFSLSFVAQGLAFACFYPLFSAIFADTFYAASALKWFGVMLFFSVVSFVAKWKGHDFDYTGKIVDVAHDIRTALGEKLKSMPLEKLHSYKTGDLNSIFASNVDEAVLHMGVVAALFLQIIIVPVVVVAVTFFVDWRLAIVMAALFPLVIPLYIKKRKAAVVEKSDFNKANAALESDLIEYVQGLAVLRSLNQTGENSKRLQNSVELVRKVQIKGVNDSTAPLLGMGVLIELILLSVVLFGVWFVSENTVSLVTLGAMLVMTARLTEPLSLFLGVVPTFDLMDSAFTRIKEILGTKPLVTLKKTARKVENFDISFNGVSFAYSSESKNALVDIDFTIPSRSMTAIVGPSGSGKTTITKLLMRYADPKQGNICIGGLDIRSMGQEELMGYISAVFQDVYLFDDTVLNNIRMGKPSATDEEVEAAATAAHCHEFISRLPNGYDTQIGDIGGALSGGERQRISIARAILKDAPIVILDEPTAALDTESEVAVQSAIDALIKDKTVIVIAHRLSTIAAADRIFVMDDGRLIESGTHDELVGIGGRYYAMWSAQQRIKSWNL